jgi:hypothetical protein
LKEVTVVLTKKQRPETLHSSLQQRKMFRNIWHPSEQWIY